MANSDLPQRQDTPASAVAQSRVDAAPAGVSVTPPDGYSVLDVLNNTQASREGARLTRKYIVGNKTRSH